MRQKWLQLYEAEVAAIIEHSQGVPLRQASDGVGDFVIGSGKWQKTIDILGMPKNQMAHFKMKDFKNSIKAHFLKSVDVVALDLRSFSAEQSSEIMKYIKENFSDQLSRLLTIQ